MTEEEKRQWALDLLQQSLNRPVLSVHNAALEASLRRSEKQKVVFDALAQQGITWNQLRDAYEEEFSRGHKAMIDHHMAYFYAGIAIVFHEYNASASPETVANFVKAVCTMPDEITDRPSLIKKCLEEVGIDVRGYDSEITHIPSRATLSTDKATRKDREAVARMRKTGITETDLSYERNLGYKNGWNSGFNFSVCYGAAAIVLSRQYEYTSDAIERFVERVDELRYEEISTRDILERARQEAGVDVSELVTT